MRFFTTVQRKLVISMSGAVILLALFSAYFFNTSAALPYDRSSLVRIVSTQPTETYTVASALISYTPQQAPTISVQYFPDEGYYQDAPRIENLSLEIYELIPDDVLKSLAYTTKNDDGYERYERIDYQPASDTLYTVLQKTAYKSGDAITLPIEGSGAWLIRAIVDGKLYNDAVVHRSSIGTIIKEEADELLTWSQDVMTGKRLTSGYVELYSLNDSPKKIAEKVISADGIAMLPLTEKGDIAIARSINGDYAIVPLNVPDGYSYSYGYSEFATKEVNLSNYLFTDRPIYQPGDTVHYKSIARTDTDAVYTVPSGLLEARLYAGWDRTVEPVYTKIIALDANGTINDSFTLPETLTPDVYQLEVGRPNASVNQEYWLRSVTTFQVEHYRKPEYSLESNVRTHEVVSGDTIDFTLRGAYFFGQPLSNQTITVSTYLNKNSYFGYLSKEDAVAYAQYDVSGWWGNEKISTQPVTLSATGEASISIPTNNITNDGNPYIISLVGEYNDESGNRVETATNVIVRPAAIVLEVDQHDYSGSVGESKQVTFKINSLEEDKPQSNLPINITGTRTSWKRIKSASENEYNEYGRYRYEHSEEKLEPVTLTTDSNGQASYTFTPTGHGSYDFVVTATDTNGRVVVRSLQYWVYDQGEIGYSYSDPYNQNPYLVTIATDKNVAYKKEEVVQLTIGSEERGRDVLLTTERESVRRYQVVAIPEHRITIPFSLTDTDLPNIFVSVSGFSPNGFGAATENIVLDTTEKAIDVAVSYDQSTYAPGETVRVTVETTGKDDGKPVAADVALWAIDKSLFELASDNRSPIKDFFWRERYNETSRAHSLEGIAAIGGAEKGCFVSGTQVLLPDGTTRSIEDLKIGDTVLTRTTSGALVSAEVTATMTHEVDGYLIINDTLRVTPEHKIWVNDAWTVAGDIQVGDTLRDSTGTAVAVHSIAWQRELVTVHNLTVAEEHTYIAEGIWVHNDKGGDGNRDVFTDVAYWNPHVTTGADGIAVVSFTLPDNLTTWVMTAVAANNRTEVGESATEFVVTKPVIIRPITPNYIRTGDTFSLSSLTYNYTTQEQPFAVMCRIGENETTAIPTIPRNTFSQLVTTPTSFSEAAAYTFACTADAQQTTERDEVTVPLSVVTFGFPETTGFAGVGNVQYSIPLAADSSPTDSSIQVVVSPSVFGTLPQAMRYLVDYPYGCVEQTTSRFVPAIIAKENEVLFGEFLADKDLDAIIETGIKRLVELKGNQLGWAWWSSDTPDPLITMYVTEYLIRAEKLGYDIPPQVRLSLAQYTDWMSGDTGSNLSPTETQIVQLYMRGTLGLPLPEGMTPPTLTTELSPDLVSLGIIAKAMHTMPVTEDVALLLSLSLPTGSGLRWGSGQAHFFGSSDASTALALKAFTVAGDIQNAQKAALALAENRETYYWSNTFATAQSLDALTHFAQLYTPNTTGPIPYTITLNDIPVTQGALKNALDSQTINIPLPSATTTSTLDIRSTASSSFHSTVRVESFRTGRDLPAANTGLEIFRSYEGEFVPGETITVTLIARGTAINNEALVIEDFLPAGLVPINTNLKNEDQDPTAYYGNGYYYPDTVEFKPDGIVIANRWWNGDVFAYTYKARVVSRGDFYAPPAVASLMYRPEIHGRSQIHGVRVADTTAEASVFYNSDPEFVLTMPTYYSITLPWRDAKTADKIHESMHLVLLVTVGSALAIAIIGGTIWYSRRRKKLTTNTTHEPATKE